MEFRKYQHVERFGTQECENINAGVCYIFPKIDGTNSSVWLGGDGTIHAGSRNRELSIGQDNGGFFANISKDENILKCLQDNPNLRIYGEWLIPHSLKTYRDDCWRKFYVFDVIEEMGEDKFRYLPYDEYKLILDMYNIEYLPPIAIINNPTYDDLTALLDKNTYLIKDNSGAGEGIVIKRYDYVNRYGRVVWAKIVISEFKDKHTKVMCGGKVNEGSLTVEQKIVNKYVTLALCEKTLAKIQENNEDWNSRMIPQLLSTVYYDLVREDCWNFVKEFKHPIINFKELGRLCNLKIKELMPNLF